MKELIGRDTITGRLISGFGTKLIVAGIAIFIANMVYGVITDMFEIITQAFPPL